MSIVRVLLVAVLTLAVAEAEQADKRPFAPEFFKAMKWRSIGPYRGGRVTAASGVAGPPARSQPRVRCRTRRRVRTERRARTVSLARRRQVVGQGPLCRRQDRRGRCRDRSAESADRVRGVLAGVAPAMGHR